MSAMTLVSSKRPIMSRPCDTIVLSERKLETLSGRQIRTFRPERIISDLKGFCALKLAHLEWGNNILNTIMPRRRSFNFTGTLIPLFLGQSPFWCSLESYWFIEYPRCWRNPKLPHSTGACYSRGGCDLSAVWKGTNVCIKLLFAFLVFLSYFVFT